MNNEQVSTTTNGFPSPAVKIEIIVGVMTGMFREDKGGNFELVYIAGRPIVLVELVRLNNEREGVWDGTDIPTAFQVAAALGRDTGLPIFDMTKAAMPQ